MSSPLSSLKKEKRAPLKSRQAPYKTATLTEDELILKILTEEKKKTNENAPENGRLSNHDLMSSMVSRISSLEKQLAYFEETNKEKDRRIKVLEEKCEIYKNAQGYESCQVVELEKKCHKLQRQVHSMECFLEDYGMIWVGTNNSSEEEDDDYEEETYENELGDTFKRMDSLTNSQQLWKPASSFAHGNRQLQFSMDFDLVLENIKELNSIAGEGEHYVQHTKDGARLQMKEPISLTLYANGIFMFNGPFRPFEEKTTQICMQDIMDGYFPSELQQSYPDGVPFKVQDKRDVYFRDKRMEKLFPGEGYSLSPEKKNCDENFTEIAQINKATSSAPQVKTSTPLEVKTETNEDNVRTVPVDSFLSKLSSSVVKHGKIIDIRESLREVLQDKPSKNDVFVVETDVVKEMKTRLTSGRKSRPQTPGNVTTLRIKSEAGDQTYVLKMLYSQTIGDVRKYLDELRDSALPSYDLKTSFPNQTYTDDTKTMRESGLVPNATLHMVSRK